MTIQPLDAFVLFELLKRVFGGGAAASPSAAPVAAPSEAPKPAGTPTSVTSPATASTPAAQVLPTGIPVTTQTPAQATTPGLPDFPGGWEPDVPPPQSVQARAWSLLPTLWKTGQGTHVQEQTNGRWITYQAQNMSGKKGVVAFRVKGSPKGVSGAGVGWGFHLPSLKTFAKALAFTNPISAAVMAEEMIRHAAQEKNAKKRARLEAAARMARLRAKGHPAPPVPDDAPDDDDDGDDVQGVGRRHGHHGRRPAPPKAPTDDGGDDDQGADTDAG